MNRAAQEGAVHRQTIITANTAALATRIPKASCREQALLPVPLICFQRLEAQSSGLDWPCFGVERSFFFFFTENILLLLFRHLSVTEMVFFKVALI